MITPTITAIEATFTGRSQKDLYDAAFRAAAEKGLVIVSTHTSLKEGFFVLWTRMVPREEL